MKRRFPAVGLPAGSCESLGAMRNVAFGPIRTGADRCGLKQAVRSRHMVVCAGRFRELVSVTGKGQMSAQWLPGPAALLQRLE